MSSGPIDQVPADAVAAVGLDELPGDDALGAALHYLRMDGVFYCQSELSAPWGLELPAMPDNMWFHVVTSGSGQLCLPDGSQRPIEAGDVIVLPHGTAHEAFDASGSPTPLVFDLPHEYVTRQFAILRHGGGGAGAHIVCGLVQLGHPAAQSLLAMLPDIIHIDAATTRDEWKWLPAMLDLMAAEATTTRPGGETVVTRLSDVLVIQALRHWIDNDDAAAQGWLGAMRDPMIGRSMAHMHAEPSKDWTVASLAADVGLSRSAFAARFNELVGVPPKQYLTTWRMQLATDRLRTESVSMLTLATDLGYQSEAAFSRAFKRETGHAPSHVRRDARLRT